jgi:CHASE2 domain-containing sensor protein/signal transduction histidine kinase
MKPWQELAWRLLPGGLVAVLIGGFQAAGLISQTEQLSYDRLFKLRGERPWDQRIVVVAIDDASLQKLGRYPWPRQRFTQLLNVLQQQQASTVAFDVIFSEPAGDDRAFAQAIAAQGQVILAQAADFNGLPLQPVPQLESAALGTGHIYRRTDGDGITRKIPLTFRGEPALSAITQQAYGVTHPVPDQPNPDGDLWLNWVGPVRHMQQYSFADVLNGQVPATALRDKIVVVGVTATGFDTLSTPFDRNPPATGTYLHATAIHNLLNQNALQTPFSGWEFSAIWLLAMPGFGWGLSYLKAKWQVFGTSSLVGLWWAGAVLALGSNYYLPTVLPIVLLSSTAAAVAIIERLRMHDFLQRQLQQLSQTYLFSQPPELTAIEGHNPIATPQLPITRSPRKFQLPSSQPASIQTLNQLLAIASYFGQAQATQQAITQSLSVGILAIDRQGTIWFCNETAQRWLAVAMGNPIATGLVPLWLDAAQWEQLFAEFLAQPHGARSLTSSTTASATPSSQWQYETAVLVNDRWFSLNFTPLQASTPHRPDGTCASQTDGASLVLLIEDITSRKQIETNLERQIQELQWLAQLKDELIGRVSHELRSPITNMLVSIELLRTTENPTQRQKYLDLLEQECLQERNFINDLLNLQVPQVIAPERVCKPIVLSTWLPPRIAPFVARGQTRQQTITIDIAPNLPVLYSDQAVVERIYQELLTNACKYSPAEATIYCTAAQSGDSIHLTVRNLGVTIPPEALPRIFEKFYRIPESDPWKQGGTGLGLSIVDRLASQIQARIQVRSADDVTEFQLQVPIIQPTAIALSLPS